MLTARLMYNDFVSRERMTVYTQYSNEPDMYFEPQFVMKGLGKCKAMKEVQETAPEGVLVQWAEKGSYRLEQMLKTIETLPNRATFWNKNTGQNFAIYILDNYR